MILAVYTLIHVLISLMGIFSGFVVLSGLLTAKRLDNWTAIFLTTTVLTSVTGFFFPVHHFMPSHALGIISLAILAVAIYARYPRNLAGAWRWIYVATALMALYLDVFVAVVQAFLKIPSLKELAPTQTEAPFKITQLVVLSIFVVLGIISVIKFRDHGADAKPAFAS
jgi:hypothetical protein